MRYKMQAYTTRPRSVTAMEVTEYNAEDLATLVGGEVIWDPDPRFTNPAMYPIVSWAFNFQDQQGQFAHRGSYIVNEGWRYVMEYPAILHSHYELKETS